MKRVSIVPGSVKKIKDLDVDLWVEAEAGEKSGHTDQSYQEQGAEIVDRTKLLSSADLIISIEPLLKSEWSSLKNGVVLVAQFQPYVDEHIVGELEEAKLTALSLDMIPRTTLAQSMDVLSSMANLSGYKAVLQAADHYGGMFPMMMTAAGTIRPAKVMIIGAGVAGLQAIATARRLGAVVEAFDTRAAAKEEVMSLGAKFIEVEGAKDDTSAGGYAVEQSEEYKKRQQELVQEKASQANIIITTAQVRGRKAPLIIPKSTLDAMQEGSVIVDLAASTGGNCELTEDDKIIDYQGIKIIGNSNLSDLIPEVSSTLYSNNVVNYLKTLIKDGQLVLDPENEIIEKSTIAKTA